MTLRIRSRLYVLLLFLLLLCKEETFGFVPLTLSPPQRQQQRQQTFSSGVSTRLRSSFYEDSLYNNRRRHDYNFATEPPLPPPPPPPFDARGGDFNGWGRNMPPPPHLEDPQGMSTMRMMAMMASYAPFAKSGYSNNNNNNNQAPPPPLPFEFRDAMFHSPPFPQPGYEGGGGGYPGGLEDFLNNNNNGYEPPPQPRRNNKTNRVSRGGTSTSDPFAGGYDGPSLGNPMMGMGSSSWLHERNTEGGRETVIGPNARRNNNHGGIDSSSSRPRRRDDRHSQPPPPPRNNNNNNNNNPFVGQEQRPRDAPPPPPWSYRDEESSRGPPPPPPPPPFANGNYGPPYNGPGNVPPPYGYSNHGAPPQQTAPRSREQPYDATNQPRQQEDRNGRENNNNNRYPNYNSSSSQQRGEQQQSSSSSSSSSRAPPRGFASPPGPSSYQRGPEQGDWSPRRNPFHDAPPPPGPPPGQGFSPPPGATSFGWNHRPGPYPEGPFAPNVGPRGSGTFDDGFGAGVWSGPPPPPLGGPFESYSSSSGGRPKPQRMGGSPMNDAITRQREMVVDVLPGDPYDAVYTYKVPYPDENDDDEEEEEMERSQGHAFYDSLRRMEFDNEPPYQNDTYAGSGGAFYNDTHHNAGGVVPPFDPSHEFYDERRPPSSSRRRGSNGVQADGIADFDKEKTAQQAPDHGGAGSFSSMDEPKGRSFQVDTSLHVDNKDKDGKAASATKNPTARRSGPFASQSQQRQQQRPPHPTQLQNDDRVRDLGSPMGSGWIDEKEDPRETVVGPDQNRPPRTTERPPPSPYSQGRSGRFDDTRGPSHSTSFATRNQPEERFAESRPPPSSTTTNSREFGRRVGSGWFSENNEQREVRVGPVVAKKPWAPKKNKSTKPSGFSSVQSDTTLNSKEAYRNGASFDATRHNQRVGEPMGSGWIDEKEDPRETVIGEKISSGSSKSRPFKSSSSFGNQRIGDPMGSGWLDDKLDPRETVIGEKAVAGSSKSKPSGHSASFGNQRIGDPMGSGWLDDKLDPRETVIGQNIGKGESKSQPYRPSASVGDQGKIPEPMGSGWIDEKEDPREIVVGAEKDRVFVAGPSAQTTEPTVSSRTQIGKGSSTGSFYGSSSRMDDNQSAESSSFQIKGGVAYQESNTEDEAGWGTASFSGNNAETGRTGFGPAQSFMDQGASPLNDYASSSSSSSMNDVDSSSAPNWSWNRSNEGQKEPNEEVDSNEKALNWSFSGPNKGEEKGNGGSAGTSYEEQLKAFLSGSTSQPSYTPVNGKSESWSGTYSAPPSTNGYASPSSFSSQSSNSYDSQNVASAESSHGQQMQSLYGGGPARGFNNYPSNSQFSSTSVNGQAENSADTTSSSYSGASESRVPSSEPNLVAERQVPSPSDNDQMQSLYGGGPPRR